MQASAYIPQAHNQWQLRGKHKFIWGGRDVECTPTQPSSPITRSTEHGERSINMRSVPLPFSHVLRCTCQASTCNDMPGTPVPFMIYRGREVQTPRAFQALGIRHATYIKYSTHNTTLFYISIVHIEKICT